METGTSTEQQNIQIRSQLLPLTALTHHLKVPGCSCTLKIRCLTIKKKHLIEALFTQLGFWVIFLQKHFCIHLNKYMKLFQCQVSPVKGRFWSGPLIELTHLIKPRGTVFFLGNNLFMGIRTMRIWPSGFTGISFRCRSQI